MTDMKFIMSLIIVCLATIVVYAQPINKSSTEQLRVFGTELYENGDYINAIEKLKEYYKEERDNIEVAYMLADASYKIKDFKYANSRYKLLFKKDEDGEFNKDLFNYGRSLKMMGEYELASDVLEKFIEFTDNEGLRELAKIEFDGAQQADDMLETLGLSVERLKSKEINSKQSEYSPSYASDGQTMYYASLATNKLIVLDGSAEEDYHLKIYKSKKGEKGKWEKPTVLSSEINREDFHTGNVKISPDGQAMYFTRAEIDPSTNEVTSSKIYVSFGSDGDWGPAQEVQGVNGAYLAKHPAIGELFGREVMYFSSDMEGGDGGFDIYYATNKGDGVFGDPVRLLQVNTPGDEETPFYKDGNLYFSSTGFPGLGGYDIFYSTWDGKRWSNPINMGKGYNSPLDDLFFSLSPDGYNGFLTSNREGTSSVESSTCCNDIYEVALEKVEATLVTGAFTEDKKPIDSTDFQLIEIVGGSLGKTDAKNSDKTNKVNYALELEKAYMIIASKDGYFPDTLEFNTVELDESTDFAKVLYLKKKPAPPKPPKEPEFDVITINQPIELKNILYDFDDDKILPEAEIDLNVILNLMNQYPEMKIQLNSHTDAQGKDKYNQELSQRRASSAKRWLIQNGIEVTRIRAVGKGETEIRNECTNGVKCDDDQHRFNRRTEFVIIEGPTTIQIEKKQFKKNN